MPGLNYIQPTFLCGAQPYSADIDFSTLLSIYDLMHILPMWLQLEEATVYNINDPFLLLFRHLVIARQT